MLRQTGFRDAAVVLLREAWILILCFKERHSYSRCNKREDVGLSPSVRE